jgi:hypothetical protein
MFVHFGSVFTLFNNLFIYFEQCNKSVELFMYHLHFKNPSFFKGMMLLLKGPSKSGTRALAIWWERLKAMEPWSNLLVSASQDKTVKLWSTLF